jgi:hypothetical protein
MRSRLDYRERSSVAKRISKSAARKRSWLGGLLLPLLIVSPPEGWTLSAQVQTDQKAATIAVVDGGAGPCTVEFTVTDPDSKPVYAAQISTHVAYGFMGLHKLDLTVYTNSDGKAKFAGLPSKVQKPPLVFQASKDKETGTAAYNPAAECQAKHDIVLRKP